MNVGDGVDVAVTVTVTVLVVVVEGVLLRVAVTETVDETVGVLVMVGDVDGCPATLVSKGCKAHKSKQKQAGEPLIATIPDGLLPILTEKSIVQC